MFNVANLLTASALSMGVATATPIRNAKNTPYTETAETQIQDYDIQITKNGQTQETDYTSDDTIGPIVYWGSQTNQTVKDNEYKTNYQVSNNYVNVIATKYETVTWKNVQDITGGTARSIKKSTTVNYYSLDYLNNNFENYNTKTSTTLLVFQIDSYNFNLNTNLNLKTQIIGPSNYNFESTIDMSVTGISFIKETYITYQSNWSTYLNRTITKYQAQTIKEQIENVNNGFYYTKNTTKVNYTGTDQIDTTQVDLTPNGTTYVVIKYTPMTQVNVETDTDTWQAMSYVYPVSLINWQTYDYGMIKRPTITDVLRIEGTNIVPDVQYEVIDLPGLMWEILTMPFAFISQAFNLTLFPGTPYQLNISNLFLSIIAVAVFIWLITFFLKIKG